MATKNPTPPRSIGRQLNFTTGRMNALCQARLDPHNLTLPQWVILSCLWRDGDLTVGTLAGLIGSGLPATSRLVERMSERGLVERRRDRDDGRVMIVRATDKGRALRHLAGFHETINATLLAGFDANEIAQVYDLLERMQRNAQAALDIPD